MYLKGCYKSILSVYGGIKTMIYNGDNKQIKNEIKKLLIDEGITFVSIANKLDISNNQLFLLSSHTILSSCRNSRKT